MQLSRNAHRAIAAQPPRLRGTIHLAAAIGMVPIGIVAVAVSRPGIHRFAVAIYVVASVVMLGLSAAMHRRRRDLRGTERWVRLDHTGIYLMIATAVTSVALVGMTAPWRNWVIAASWLLAGFGLVVEWLPRATPRGFAHTMFLVNGWLAVVMVWQLWQLPQVGRDAVAWLLAGGLCYTLGAVVVAVRRPDPWPAVFGYHEIWHAMVVIAVLCHLWLITVVLAQGIDLAPA
ncbi:MAG TPA: hemolysin III family protein [Nitriliruptoraceae bacterium]|nr:hemolysin III family protein [Nitriliruptoraceae bacterium]